MTRLGAFLCVAAVSVGLGCGGEGRARQVRGWSDDLDAARKRATAAGRPLAILYSAGWSGACRSFEERALAAPEVLKELERFEKVRLDVVGTESAGGGAVRASEAAGRGVTWLPTLVLESPSGETLKLDGGDYPPDFLAGELGRLGEWQPLEGWESDPERAGQLSAASGKPLAVLYSGAWNRDAVQYEEKDLAGIRDQLASGFTLLRLNFAANRERAQRDQVKGDQDVPALLLNLSGGGRELIAGRHDGPLIGGFVQGLSRPREAPAGWSSDPQEVREVRAGRKRSRMVVVLDKAAHWESHRFLYATLRKPEVAGLLDAGFVRVRLDYRQSPELAAEFGVRETDLPVMLIFNSYGEYHQKRNFKSDVRDIASELRAVGGRTEAAGQPEAE